MSRYEAQRLANRFEILPCAKLALHRCGPGMSPTRADVVEGLKRFVFVSCVLIHQIHRTSEISTRNLFVTRPRYFQPGEWWQSMTISTMMKTYWNWLIDLKANPRQKFSLAIDRTKSGGKCKFKIIWQHTYQDLKTLNLQIHSIQIQKNDCVSASVGLTLALRSTPKTNKKSEKLTFLMICSRFFHMFSRFLQQIFIFHSFPIPFDISGGTQIKAFGSTSLKRRTSVRRKRSAYRTQQNEDWKRHWRWN